MNETTKHIDPLDTPHNPIISLGQDDQGREIEIMDNRDGTYTNLYMEILFSDSYMCAFYSKQFAAKRQLNCCHPKNRREIVADTQEGQIGFGADGVNASESVDHFERCGICHIVTQEHVLIDEEVSNE